jgi:hypothetical protein
MSTQQSDARLTFEISVKANAPDYNNTFLIIQGYSKEYPFQIKDGSLKIQLPDSLTVRNIYISVMGYGKRQLPFDDHHNFFRYDYILNDTSPHVSFIKKECWNLPVRSQNKKGYFRLSNTNYLSKADQKIINFLRELADKNVEVRQLTSDWFND